MCDKLGIRGEQVIFTSNDTPAEEFIKARDLNAIINLDDLGYGISLFGTLTLTYRADTLNSWKELLGCQVIR